MDNFLDQISSETEAADGFKKHPLGEFNAEIVKVTQRLVNNQTPCFDVDTVTAYGNAPSYKIWGFSQQDISEAQYNGKKLEQMKNSIGYIKKMLAEVLNVDKDKASKWTWSQIEQCIGILQGKKCRLVVQVDKKDPKYRRVFINAASNEADIVVGEKPQPSQNSMNQQNDMSNASAMQPQQAQQAYQNHNAQNQNQQQYTSMQSPGSYPDLGDVPF